MKHLLFALVALSFSACASATRIVPEGPDSYVAMKQAATGFAGTQNVKMDAIEDASAFCAKGGKQFKITRTQETPGGMGRYPTAEVGFVCLNPGDPELTRPNLTPSPNTVIEVRH